MNIAPLALAALVIALLLVADLVVLTRVMLRRRSDRRAELQRVAYEVHTGNVRVLPASGDPELWAPDGWIE